MGRQVRELALDASPPQPAGGRPWLSLAGLLGLAVLWRWVFFNGTFGSDDAVYLTRALDVATGTWSSANYNGALRYGFNIPAGVLLALGPHNELVANLWSLLCSLGEIGLVFFYARRHFGERCAAFAALLLGLAPLHVAVATRIHADPVVAFFLTAAYVSLDSALRSRSLWACLLGGLALGAVFWTKELAAVVYVALVPALWFFRRFVRGAVVALAGLLLMLALHGWLMWLIAGDPLHAVRVVLSSMQRNFVQGGGGEDSPAYYLRYLFLDVRHVGLLGWLALMGAVVLALPSRPAAVDAAAGPSSRAFLWLWAGGLLLVLSAFPVSLSPLRFTMKQSNYLSLFLAPLSVLAALGLCWFGARGRVLLLAVGLPLALLLAALQQADYRSFTANSKAVLRTYAGRADVLLVGSSNLQGLAPELVQLGLAPVAVTSFRDVLDQPEAEGRKLAAAPAVVAVIDPQTSAWFAGKRAIDQPMACWQLLGPVQPADLGFGNAVAAAVAAALRQLPIGLAARAAQAFDKLARPATAQVYRVPAGQLWCEG